MSGGAKTARSARIRAAKPQMRTAHSVADSQPQPIPDRITDSEKNAIAKLTIDHIQRHARAHGSFSGFADFLSQCDQIIAQTRAQRGKLQITLANSLARDVSSIRDTSESLAPETMALLFRGFTTGFLFANLKREIDESSTRTRRKKVSGAQSRAAVATKSSSAAPQAKTAHRPKPKLRKREKKYPG